MVGVADGVSQLEEFGMDPAELPNELLRCCEELAMNQLMPGKKVLCVSRSSFHIFSKLTLCVCWRAGSVSFGVRPRCCVLREPVQ